MNSSALLRIVLEGHGKPLSRRENNFVRPDAKLSARILGIVRSIRARHHVQVVLLVQICDAMSETRRSDRRDDFLPPEALLLHRAVSRTNSHSLAHFSEHLTTSAPGDHDFAPPIESSVPMVSAKVTRLHDAKVHRGARSPCKLCKYFGRLQHPPLLATAQSPRARLSAFACVQNDLRVVHGRPTSMRDVDGRKKARRADNENEADCRDVETRPAARRRARRLSQ